MNCNRCGRDNCAEENETCPSKFIVGDEVYWIGGDMDLPPTLGLFLGLEGDGGAKIQSDSGTDLVYLEQLVAREKWPVMVLA
jgi:hypothetical protein